MIYLFYIIATLLAPTSCFFRSIIHSWQRKHNLHSDNYEFAKEYYDFYCKFRNPVIQSNGEKINYDNFVDKNKDKYVLFEKNWRSINQTNTELMLQNNSFRLELNKYADIVDFENKNNVGLMNNTIISNKFRPTAYLKVFQSPFPYIETIFNQNKKITYNWNDTGLLSPVKNQGSCGSCWAFSTVSALETFMRINGVRIDRLSEQELVDCSEENYGCEGGLMHLAFDYVIKKGGLLNYNVYPYNAINQQCFIEKNQKQYGSHLSDYQFTIPKSILDMKMNLIQTPITIALDADNIFFRFYKEGIIDIPSNVNSSMNHAVLLVGFDYDDEGMYWIIQNSWGSDWGDNGFCRIRAVPGEGVLLCQQYGVYPTKLYSSFNDKMNYQI
jgi:C1A family cysteine protease